MSPGNAGPRIEVLGEPCPACDTLAPHSGRDRFQAYRSLREGSAWSYCPHFDAIVIGTHTGVTEAFTDPDLGVERPTPRSTRTARPIAPLLARVDGCEHQRLRRPVGRRFSPSSIRSLRPWIEDIVACQLETTLASQPTVDLVPAFCAPVATEVAFGVAGVEDPDLRERISELVPGFFPDSAPKDLRAVLRYIRTQDLIRDYVATHGRQRAPVDAGGTASTRVSVLEASAHSMSTDEAVGLVILTVLGGLEPTRNLLANALQQFLCMPDGDRAALVSGRLFDRFVEETLRHEPPVHTAQRWTQRTLSAGRHEIAPGTTVYLLLAAANRDPEVFADPDTFRLDRPRTSRLTLSFGLGHHYCLGASVARLTATIAVEALSETFPHASSHGPPVWKDTLLSRTVERLPVDLRTR